MVVLHMNRKSTHDGCSFLLASASVTFFFMFTSDDTLHRPFKAGALTYGKECEHEF